MEEEMEARIELEKEKLMMEGADGNRDKLAKTGVTHREQVVGGRAEIEIADKSIELWT